MLTILIPAAGQSSRMRGTDKLLEDVYGAPCLRTMALRALKVTASVFVTLRLNDTRRQEALNGLALTLLPTPDAQLGMFASLRHGAQNIPKDISAFMVLPADMPGITAHDMATLWAAFQTLQPGILRAGNQDGTPGHPILFSKSYLPQFRALSGPKDSKAILERNQRAINILPLSGDRATRDLDTPEDWAKWRAENPLGFG